MAVMTGLRPNDVGVCQTALRYSTQLEGSAFVRLGTQPAFELIDIRDQKVQPSQAAAKSNRHGGRRSGCRYWLTAAI